MSKKKTMPPGEKKGAGNGRGQTTLKTRKDPSSIVKQSYHKDMP